MNIVIDIPEEVYERFGHEYREENLISKYTNDVILEAFCNGTPLPKRHGRLVILSEDIVKREQTSLRFSCQNWISEVGLSNATVAIIEEDKAESER